MSQHGPAGYTPYKNKRLSSQSVQSVNSVVAQSPPPATRPAGLVRPSSTSAIVPTLNHVKAAVQSPQPYRPTASTSWSHSGAVAGPSSTPPPNSSAGRRPTPTQSVSALPFSNVSSDESPFGTPSRAGSQSPAVGGSTAGASQRPYQGRGSSAQSERARAPYHTTFQPQGVRRDRTEEFLSQRKSQGEGKKLEEGRLSRRLEKLVALHFPPPSDKSSKETPQGPSLSTLSAFGDSIRGKSARELWSSVAGSRGEVERAEQGIVKWQDDSSVKTCPICMASFGLKARRHHCRLCGRVVCFLPPTPMTVTSSIDPPSPSVASPSPKPMRRERCSTFITYEHDKTAMTEKAPSGIVVEVEPVEQDLSFGAMTGELSPSRDRDERKKVRVCRDCLNIIMRQQLKTHPVRTPTWLKLYDVLIQLEKEIDEVLPEFQELVLGIQKPTALESTSHPSISQAKTLRNRLLTSLASYDTISKRIKDLPLSEGSLPGGSQDRLQLAVAARGTLFLSEKLALLRSLGNMEELSGSGASKKSKRDNSKDEPGVKTLASLLAESGDGAQGSNIVNEKVGAEMEASGRLAVLLEQEALVRSYVEDANSRRQFEDAASLNASLDELRFEIDSVRATLL